MSFEYDAANDIIIATPHWKIADQQDCEVWFNQWESYLAKYKRKVDCIMVLDDFHVDPAIASVWGEYRAKINIAHIRHSFRVNADRTVKLFIKTSGVRFNAAKGEAPSLADAVEGILDARKKGS